MRKKKITLDLALTIVLTSARFNDVRCFTRLRSTCVAGENKVFMLVPMLIWGPTRKPNGLSGHHTQALYLIQ